MNPVRGEAWTSQFYSDLVLGNARGENVMGDVQVNIGKLRNFVVTITRLANKDSPGPQLMEAAKPQLAELVAGDDWLPQRCAAYDERFYRQYLLHCDPLERFSLVSFVWGPGQKTPIHDHRVWGLIGVLRGAETVTRFARETDGQLAKEGESVRLEPGDVDSVAPEIGDIHQVANAYADRVSISIHLYGGNIGSVSRHVYDLQGNEKSFVSGYSSDCIPNLWDRSFGRS